MSQSTDDLTRSELRAIRGHYRRRVYIAFLIPAVIAIALGWLLFQDQDAQSGPGGCYMAALLVLVLAVGGGLMVGDLVWENTRGAEVAVFGQPVTGSSRGWLLAGAAMLGVVVALLLVASVGRPRDAGSVAGNSAGCGVIDVITDPTRTPNQPACWMARSI